MKSILYALHVVKILDQAEEAPGVESSMCKGTVPVI